MTFLSPSPTKLGVVCLARTTFEHELALQWYQQAQTALRELDRSLAEIEIYFVEKLVVEPADAQVAVEKMREVPVDALVVVNGTFALGGLAQTIATLLDLPILLWAWPEPTEQTGTLRFNSLVGMHLNASNLHKLGLRPATLYAAPAAPEAMRAVAQFAKIASIVHDLRRLRIGLIGGHAPGFDNLAVNKLALRRALGVEVVDIGLPTLVAKAKSIEKEHIHIARTEMLESFNDVSEVSYVQSEQYAALILAVSNLAKEQNFDAFALKCWGDLVEQYGIAGCGAVAKLNDSGLVVGCEGDVLGAVTMLIAQRLCGAPAFLTDLVSINATDNTGFCWHIGCAPLCLANPNKPKHLFAHFANGKGLTAGFPLKAGRLTILRLGDDGRNLRMLATTGQALECELEARGTVANVQFDGNAQKFLDELLSNGWEHHIALAYGDIVPELEMLCRALNVPLTKI
jgi:L-fucose isomerase-like protein